MNFNQELVSILDLTSLNETDTPESIAALCQKAETPYGKVAAVCVYPRFVKQVTALLHGKAIQCATVVNFPQGTHSLKAVRAEIAQSMEDGAQEIDVVFSYQAYLNGQQQEAISLVRACKEQCATSVLLKVIIETGALKESALIAEVTESVIDAGADFVKTSTGKISPGATLEASAVILTTIQKLSVTLQRPIGFKAAGGIRTKEEATEYLRLAKEILGPSSISPQRFRIGTSQLLDKL